MKQIEWEPDFIISSPRPKAQVSFSDQNLSFVSRWCCCSRNLSHFYAPEIEDLVAFCFCPVCHSVILSETLILLITFEQ